jgi:hypothetical protein
LGLPEEKNTSEFAIGGIVKVNLARYVVDMVVICAMRSEIHLNQFEANAGETTGFDVSPILVASTRVPPVSQAQVQKNVDMPT